MTAPSSLQSHSGYAEIPTSAFVDKVDLQMAELPPISFFEEIDGKLVQFREGNQPYSSMALTSRKTVWIREADLLGNPKLTAALPLEKRMETLRSTSIQVMDDLFQHPTQENLSRSVKVVGSFVYNLMKDPHAYLFLSKLSQHDPYTLQHSVGTSVNCIILARKVGITDPKDLEEVGLAGLLHDIGKVKVKREIINKEGPLDELEWEEMRQHSTAGYEIIKDHPEISERTKLAILQHHEDKTGTGYPNRLKSTELDIFSRIVCLCDIFNALTTDRTYSKARSPFDAFALMREKLIHKIDDDLFKQLVKVYGGSLDAA